MDMLGRKSTEDRTASLVPGLSPLVARSQARVPLPAMSPIANQMAPFQTSVVERFLRYVTFDTQSTETSETYPSTAKQLDLLRHLVAELKALGLADVAIDEHGYVMATLPATTQKTGVPVIGFIAHVDTSPEVSG